MQIGTPLSPSATRVMVLGSGELGKELIIALQRLGVETIAVDRYANAPGHQVAHRAHVIAMTDSAALKRLIEQERPQIIVPEIEAIATDVLSAVEESGIAEVIPTARATALTMNREGIRRLAAETLNLPTSAYRFVASPQELNAAILGDTKSKGLGFPCVVKPVISSSGKGQSILRSKNDIPAAWQYAESAARVRGGRVIVEEYIPFDYEITLLAVRSLGSDGVIETHFASRSGMCK
jgi:phosphoribosylglycinamide formyltransferase 2